MPKPVADSAAKFELVYHGALALFEIGHMVVLEQLGATAVDAHPVAFFDDSFLTSGWMPLTRGRVDWLAICIMDQRSDERLVHQLRHRRLGYRRSIVQRRSIASNVDHDLYRCCPTSIAKQ